MFAYFVIGLPGETKDTVKKTVALAKSLDPDYVNFHIATPHPGTDLHEMAEKNNWITDYDYSHYDQSGDYSVMKNDSMSAKEILAAQKMAMKSYYLRPNILLRHLSRISRPEEIIGLIRIGLNILKG